MTSKPLFVLLATTLLAGPTLTQAFEIQPRGRIHVDYATHFEDERELGDGFHVRRARLGLSGKIDDDWSYLIEYDFAENDAEARDVLLRYTGWSAGTLTIGHFKVPFSLDELIGSNNFSFIERPLPVTTFAQSRRLGVGFDAAGSHWTASIMGFGQGSGSGTRSTTGDEGLGIGARLTFNPVLGSERLVHLGIAATSEQPEDSDVEQVRYRTRPESRPTDVRLVDTGSIGDVRRINQLGLEAAWQHGPFSAQGEYLQARVQRSSAQPDLAFDGWYVSASWVLTGESRGYRSGVFRGINPQGSRGAWELVGRFSTVKLDDGPVAGGKQDNWSIGVNWYANARVRLMANHIQVKSRRAGVSDDSGILLARVQVAF